MKKIIYVIPILLFSYMNATDNTSKSAKLEVSLPSIDPEAKILKIHHCPGEIIITEDGFPRHWLEEHRFPCPLKNVMLFFECGQLAAYKVVARALKVHEYRMQETKSEAN